MTKIQIDLDENEDLTTELYKLTHNQKTKQEAIKHMILKTKKIQAEENKIAKELNEGLNAMEE